MNLPPLRRTLLIFGAAIVVALATFVVLLNLRPSDTIGEALLHVYYKSPTMAVLALPPGWRARYGIDRHEQCAILIDDALVPRVTACTFGYGPDNPEYRNKPVVDASVRAGQAAAARRNADERVSSDMRETRAGPIHHVVRTYTSPASHHVVTTGQVVEHEFFRLIGNDVHHLRTYEDAAQRSSLDPIAWELAQSMRLVGRP